MKIFHKKSTMLAVISCLVLFLLPAHFSGANSVHFSNFLRQEESCPADARDSWSYRGDNGPQYWGQNYPECNGNSQSPININTADVVNDPDLGKLQLVNYDVPISSGTFLNNGRTIQLKPNDGVERTMEAEGSTYTLDHLHIHWGNTSEIGSEHTLDGRSYAGELHLVHVNANNQLAVIAVFYKEIGECNVEHQEIAENFPKYRNEVAQLNGNLRLTDLLPENPSSFYRYHGSLTTPRCSEGVIWTVLKGYQTVCPAQMERLRVLHSDTRDENNHGCHLVSNFRCVQPLNGRVVYESQ